jgi:hypothetical protein
VGRTQSDIEKVREAATMLTEVIKMMRGCERSELVLPLIGQTVNLRERYFFIEGILLPKRPGEENQ